MVAELSVTRLLKAKIMFGVKILSCSDRTSFQCVKSSNQCYEAALWDSRGVKNRISSFLEAAFSDGEFH